MTAELNPWTVNSDDILDARLYKLKEGESLYRGIYIILLISL
jgi:hypothetical protein